jgi:excisionase family DNA binding protein
MTKGVPRAMQTPGMLTIPEAAEILGCSNATIRRRVKDGSLKAERMVGPNGSQYFIDPDDLNVAMETTNVVPFKHEVGMKELDQLIAQSVSMSLSEMGSIVGEAMRVQNEALKKEIEDLHDSMKAMEKRQEERDAASEKRQKEREATHFELVDQRLKDLHIEPKKGFWARLFGK